MRRARIISRWVSGCFEANEELQADSSLLQNIQSTNWQTVRFKPPPPDSPIGWRVEFRSMEVQLTDYENAAFAVFIVLLTRAIMNLGLNFYIPISKVSRSHFTLRSSLR